MYRLIAAHLAIFSGSLLCSAQVFTEYPVISQGILEKIKSGPDGNLWFAELDAGKIGRMTTSGALTEFPVPSGQPYNLTLGPDGAFWFTEPNNDRIGRITLTGVVTEYPLPSGSQPYDIIAGPDGNLWFTAQFGNYVGKMSPIGVLLATFSTPSPLPLFMTIGPDGNIWFAEQWGKIARITTDGGITEYAVPATNAVVIAIITGPDGNLWFTEAGGDLKPNQIGKMTPSGVFTEFPLSATSAVGQLASGPDGKIWFTDLGYYVSPYVGYIGNITVDGSVTTYAVPTLNSWPVSLAFGPDRRLWFTEAYGNKIGAFSTAPQPLANKVNLRFHYSANGSAGGWSGTKTVPQGGSTVIGPQAMEGNLTVLPGQTLATGYDFTMPGQHPDTAVAFVNPMVTFHAVCVSGGDSHTVLVSLPNANYLDPSNSPAWYPSGDQKSLSVYQGTMQVPDLCAGGAMSLSAGATFTASVGSAQ